MTIVSFTPLRTGPRLAHVCPEFREKMDEYQRAVKANPSLADKLSREAQVIAKEYRDRQNGGKA